MLETLITDEHAALLDESATATFSPCRTYRYELTRSWDTGRPTAVFIMLNPSTADAFHVDPTIRRCLAFARAWGAGGLTVLNLFALRSTYPRSLRVHADPVGPHCDAVIADALASDAGPVVVAWGAHGRYRGRDAQVLDIIRTAGRRPLCLGTTRDGLPRHPLYVPRARALADYQDGELATRLEMGARHA